jgi:hypothetical protein
VGHSPGPLAHHFQPYLALARVEVFKELCHVAQASLFIRALLGCPGDLFNKTTDLEDKRIEYNLECSEEYLNRGQYSVENRQPTDGNVKSCWARYK